VHKRGFSGLRGPKYREAAHRQSSPVAMTTGAERCDALTPFILGQLLRFQMAMGKFIAIAPHRSHPSA
ncbi:MAG TPA: hypothetical protein VGO04_10580, partial [Ensifer sp.]|uniref:hypothetical protein n=1 Tax=Ensifer sp. TaxID=1872086 RepID=UPI002E14C4D0|nr:hypothetical protein [Ensifer sp.]